MTVLTLGMAIPIRARQQSPLRDLRVIVASEMLI